jgi:hypothetical protein
MIRHARALGLAMLMLGLLAGWSEANLVTYTDRATFNANASISSLLDFEGLAPPDSFSFFSSPPGLTIGGATFTSVTDTLFVIDPDYSFPDFVWNSGQYLIDNTSEPDVSLRGLVVALPGGVTAFGTDVSSFGTGIVTVELSTGETVDVASPGQPDLGFIGFTSDVAIVSLTFNIPDDSVVLDNVAFGQAVPEPTTLVAALTGGVLTLGVARRRRRGDRAA